MAFQREIEISPQEATAYWWINTIKYKVREIILYKSIDRKEKNFAKVFINYTEDEWRNLYLELVKYITENVNNYVPLGNVYGIDAYNQDTDINGHNDINQILSEITQKKIPNIRLASNSAKDSVIYTNIFGASVWYKSCGVRKLPTRYETSYILTGDKKELDFYNLLMLTIAQIKETNPNFKSLKILSEVFCKQYQNENKEYTIEELIDIFHLSITQAIYKGIISIFHNEAYFSMFHEIDLIGLEEYKPKAQYYADIILTQKSDEETRPKTKKRI